MGFDFNSDDPPGDYWFLILDPIAIFGEAATTIISIDWPPVGGGVMRILVTQLTAAAEETTGASVKLQEKLLRGGQ